MGRREDQGVTPDKQGSGYSGSAPDPSVPASGEYPSREGVAREIMARSTIHGDYVRMPKRLEFMHTGFRLDRLAEMISKGLQEAYETGLADGRANVLRSSSLRDTDPSRGGQS